jgi:hypothetical protein
MNPDLIIEKIKKRAIEITIALFAGVFGYSVSFL